MRSYRFRLGLKYAFYIDLTILAHRNTREFLESQRSSDESCLTIAQRNYSCADLINHATKKFKWLAMAFAGMEYHQMLFRGIETDSVLFPPSVHIASTFG